MAQPRSVLRQLPPYEQSKNDQHYYHRYRPPRLLPQHFLCVHVYSERDFRFDLPDGHTYTPEALPSEPNCSSSRNLPAATSWIAPDRSTERELANLSKVESQVHSAFWMILLSGICPRLALHLRLERCSRLRTMSRTPHRIFDFRLIVSPSATNVPYP